MRVTYTKCDWKDCEKDSSMNGEWFMSVVIGKEHYDLCSEHAKFVREKMGPYKVQVTLPASPPPETP